MSQAASEGKTEKRTHSGLDDFLALFFCKEF